jgi:hypothetical protein
MPGKIRAKRPELQGAREQVEMVNQLMTATRKANLRRELNELIGITLFILFLPFIAVVIILYLLLGMALYLTVWLCWCSRGKFVLLVYSDSPIWHDYIEEQILPHLKNNTVVLNWSKRQRWQRWFPPLSVMAFRYFGSYREFNPLAVVFRPFRLARKFRFFTAFKEFKHGKSNSLEKMRQEFLDLVKNTTAKKTA